MLVRSIPQPCPSLRTALYELRVVVLAGADLAPSDAREEVYFEATGGAAGGDAARRGHTSRGAHAAAHRPPLGHTLVACFLCISSMIRPGLEARTREARGGSGQGQGAEMRGDLMRFLFRHLGA